MKTVYVVYYDWGYEGYGDPVAVYSRHDLMVKDYPDVRIDDGKVEGWVYKELIMNVEKR
jgi:hypothetical protein